AFFGELQYRAETSAAEEVDAAEIKYQWVTNINEVRQVVGDMLGIICVDLAADFDNCGRRTAVTVEPQTEARTATCDGGGLGMGENVMNGASHGNLLGRGFTRKPGQLTLNGRVVCAALGMSPQPNDNTGLPVYLAGNR